MQASIVPSHGAGKPCSSLAPVNALDIVLVLFFYVFMQAIFQFRQEADLRFMRDRLLAQFGRIPGGDRRKPIDQFICSFLGSRTLDKKSVNAFERLKRHFHTWDALADAPEAHILAIIQDVTFPEKKAQDLKRALRKIRACYGQIDLDFLECLEPESALFALEQIHGVGRKIAAATLNFSTLHGRTFVVDTHVLRILRRFGFVGENAGIEKAYDAVMEAADGFDADDLIEFHWHLKSLGQNICSHARAECVCCPLSYICSHHLKKSAA
jgi:endonuclease III